MRGIALIGFEHNMPERVTRQIKDDLVAAVRTLAGQLNWASAAIRQPWSRIISAGIAAAIPAPPRPPRCLGPPAARPTPAAIPLAAGLLGNLPAPEPPALIPCCGCVERPRALSRRQPGRFPMTVHAFLIEPIVALVAGILILVQPRLLNYVVAIYLILIGILGLVPHFMH
jgi:hypothetical protein